MEHDAHETGRQDTQPDRLGSRRRMWLTSGSLVGAGLLAGAILAGTLSANATGGGGGTAAVPAAATASQDSGGATSSSTPDPDRHGLHDWWDDWHGDGGSSVSDATSAKVKDAVLAKYPGASVWWVRQNSGGGYDGSFAVTGSSQLPDHGDLDHHGSAVSSDTAAKVTSSVVAHYPGATVPWVWADPDGGYVAYAKTSDGKGVVVHLDGSFAITSTDDVPTC